MFSIKRTLHPQLLTIFLAFFITLLSQQASAADKTLYERLGGYDAISAVVDDFAGQLFVDPKLQKFFGGMSLDSQTRFKQHNVELVCGATGGPCPYLGRDMLTAHHGLNVTNQDFDTVAGHLVITLTKFKVPKVEKDELLTIVGGLRAAIVEQK